MQTFKELISNVAAKTGIVAKMTTTTLLKSQQQ